MKNIIVALCCLLISSSIYAEIIVLKSGKKIEGKIIEKTDEAIKIDFQGVPLTYYLNDIESINGNKIDIGITSNTSIPQSYQVKKSPSQIFKDVSPAVVIITISSVGDMPAGYGSGFIISENGVVMTCLHCVSMAQNISIKTKDGQQLPVTGIIGFDPINDICLLKVDAQDLPTVSLGDAGSLEPGASIFTIGAPKNLAYSISDGLLSSNRKLFSRKLLQITAPISPGNSGGPVIDDCGRVVGVASFYHKGGQNLNFATPIDKNLKDFIQGSIQNANKRDSRILLDKFRNVLEYIKIADQYKQQWEYNHPNISDCALGRQQCADADCKSAIEYYKKSLEAGIRIPHIYEHLGSMYGFCLADHENAMFYIKQAMEIDPTLPEIILNYKEAYQARIMLLIVGEKFDKARMEKEQFLKELEELYTYIPDAVSEIKAQSEVLNMDWEKFPK